MGQMKGDMKLFFLIFIGVIISVVFLIQIANDTSAQSALQGAVNETHNITTLRQAGFVNPHINISVDHDLIDTGNTPISDFVLRSTNGTTATLTTDYLLDTATGNFSLVNSTFWTDGKNGNITTVDYSYKATTYVEDSGARLFIALILIFGALAILIFVITSTMEEGSLKKMLGM